MRVLRSLMIVLLVGGVCPMVEADEPVSRLRRPVALALSVDGATLYTANRDSGSISVVDTNAPRVIDEIEVGGRLSDVAVWDDGTLLALDQQHHELILLRRAENGWTIGARRKVPASPQGLLVDQDRARCFVASRWSRTLSCVPVVNASVSSPELGPVRELRLPFEPHELCLVPGGEFVLVAGAFQSVLGTVEAEPLELAAQHTVPGHNIRGLSMSADGKQLLLTCQEINTAAHSTRDDVHWGNMVSNQLVSVPLTEVVDRHDGPLEQRVVSFLGEPGRAAGDPGPIHVGADGAVAVALSGVDRVALGRLPISGWQTAEVGHRPSAIAGASGRLFVANMFSDSVSLLSADGTTEHRVVSLGPQPELDPAQLGETLFFNARLSHDGWMSCHSCHTDGHTSGQLNDNLSDGSFTTPKRVLSLAGVGETGPWAWNGAMETLEQQVHSSIINTMQGEEPNQVQVSALVAFLKTLPASPGLAAGGTQDDARLTALHQGRELFRVMDCQRCHAPPTYTTPQTYDVGLTDATGTTRFNPPSLRGVGRRTAFFHDARAGSLDEVFSTHQHQLDRKLSPAEVRSLVRFLQSI